VSLSVFSLQHNASVFSHFAAFFLSLLLCVRVWLQICLFFSF
jgi:hypothetical protein